MATPGEWFSSLPPLTRLYGASCFAATLASQLGLVSHYALVLFWKPVFSELQARSTRRGRCARLRGFRGCGR